MSFFALTMDAPPPLVHFLKPQSEGAGQEDAAVEHWLEQFWNRYIESIAMTDREAVLAERFQTLADKWRETIRFRSSLTEITNDPLYRAITDLGDEVVPLLLQELERRREPWFAALRAITGQDPVPVSQRGDMRAMTQAWLRWGRQRGLIR